MSSIGDSDNKKPPKSTAPTSSRPTTLKAPATATTTNQQGSSTGNTLKRKADQQSSSQSAQPRKPSPFGSAGPSRSTTNSPAPFAASKRTAKPQSSYQGTARFADQKPAGPSRTVLASKPTPSSSTTAATSSPAPAKKGYLAILERAKAAQETAKPFGQIKHHKVEREKISRKERERLAAEAVGASKKAGKPVTGAVKSTAQSRDAPSKGTTAAAPKKKKIEVSYKGTARDAPAYRGTADRGLDRAPTREKKTADAQSRYRYASESEEEDDDDDEQDYDSASTDMEAGMDDIEQEEMLSARQARQEDEAAAREEDELKRQKLERQRKLKALNAAAAAKKKIY